MKKEYIVPTISVEEINLEDIMLESSAQSKDADFSNIFNLPND